MFITNGRRDELREMHAALADDVRQRVEPARAIGDGSILADDDRSPPTRRTGRPRDPAARPRRDRDGT